MCNEAGKPEEHRDSLDAQNGIGMRGFREEARRECEEGDDEDSGPDSGEYQEVDAGRRIVDGKSVPP